jgi:flagellar basal-body rod protein FlgC
MLNLPMPRENQALGDGVKAAAIVEDPSAPQLVYNPGHPDANADGYVAMPNVNIVSEMVDMISASRAYEANISSLNASKSMAMKALDIGRI